MPDTTTSNTVEIPPNKAIAAASSAGIGSLIAGLTLHYLAPDTPPEIVGYWTGLANIVITGVITWLTPHGAIVKEGETKP